MEGQRKTKYLNRFLQTALGRKAATTMFVLHLQVATHLPVTEQFAPHAFQFLPLVLLLVMEAPRAFVSCKAWGYRWVGVVDVQLPHCMQKWLVLGNQQFLHSPQCRLQILVFSLKLIGFLILTHHLYLRTGS